MARKYSRDNRGRFASAGTGATARGGRLKTASGGKRATQTMTAKGAGGAGVVKGRPARTVAGQSVMRKLAKAAPKPAAPPKPTRSPGSKIQAPKIGGVSRTRLSGLKMNEGAGRRGAARQQRRESMAMQRQMLGSAKEKTAAIQRQVFGRVKPGRSAEPLTTGGTLAARASLGRARAKAGPGASPAQRGAVKRAGTYLKASKERNRTAVKGAMPKGTVRKGGKAKGGIKPVAILRSTQSTKLTQANRPDTAQANIPMRGVRGKRLEASISRAVKETRAAQRAQWMKPKEQVRAEAAARKSAKIAAAAAKPKRVRTPESLRLSRAKQVEKRRSINISNPAGYRADAAGKMAANAARTQQRALAFYKSRKDQGLKGGKAIGGGKPAQAGGNAKAAASKPATARPTINRTRKQAAAVQLDRKRQTLENTKAIRGRQSYIAPEGIIRKSTKINQRNILTGGIDRVTTKVQTKVQEERVSPLSSFGRKNAARSERASNRLDALIQAKRNTPKPRKATERAALAKIQKSISTVGRSFDSYRNARSGRRTKKP